MNLENLIFVLFVLAIGFVNLVLPWLRKRNPQTRSTDADSAPQDPDATPDAVAPAPAARVVERPEVARRSTSPGTAIARPAPARPVIRLAEARRAIVLRSVIGPCRAEEPYDGSVT